MIRDAVLTCDEKMTLISLIYRTGPTAVNVEIKHLITHTYVDVKGRLHCTNVGYSPFRSKQ